MNWFKTQKDEASARTIFDKVAAQLEADAEFNAKRDAPDSYYRGLYKGYEKAMRRAAEIIRARGETK